MKSIYRIIILNDRTSFNKTINIHTYLMKFLSVLILLVLGLSSFGLYKIFYPNAKDKEFNYLNNKFRDTTYLLEKLLMATNSCKLEDLSKMDMNNFLSLYLSQEQCPLI